MNKHNSKPGSNTCASVRTQAPQPWRLLLAWALWLGSALDAPLEVPWDLDESWRKGDLLLSWAAGGKHSVA